ncbi:MAG: nucleotidyltransferase family protein [Asgard group archaeon]|nr:nucleotidyltransferase family protein [Asgard group archaeon]
MSVNFKSLPVIILAAGDSQRMGEIKGLLDYKGKPFLAFQLEKLLEIGFWEIIVVLGNDYQIYQDKIPKLKNTVITINPSPEKGQFSSIQYGLLEVSKVNQSGVFILPVDVPCPEKEVWEHLEKSLSSSNANVSIPAYQGKKGHPVIISEKFKEYLLTCKTDSRLDFEINKQKDMEKAKIISVKDKNITRNLNTPENWEEFKVNP